MRWQHRLLVAVAAWFFAVAPAPAQTAQDALKVVPAKAAGFVIVNNIGEFSDKVESLSKRVGVPLPFSPLEKLRSESGIDQGLNSKGAAMGVLRLGQREDFQPIVLVYLPVTDYAQFLKGMNAQGEGDIVTVKIPREMIVGHKGSFAVLAKPEHREELRDALQGKSSGKKALAPVQAQVAQNDITGVLTSRGIKLLCGKARAGLTLAKNADQVAPQAQFMMGWLDGMDTFLQSVETDVTHLVAGGRLDKTGNLDLNYAAIFAPGSSFAKAGANGPLPEGGHLAGLPNGPYMMAFSGPLSGNLMGEMMNFSMKIMTAMAKDVPAEKIAKMKKAGGDLVKGLRSMSMVIGTGKDNDAFFHNVYAVMKVKDAAAYFKDYEVFLAEYDDLMKTIKLPDSFTNQSMKLKKTKVDGKPALEVTVDKAGEQNQNELVKKLMEAYFGPGGKMIVTTIAADNNTLLLRYTPAKTFKGFLKAYSDKASDLSQNKGIAKTMESLPAGSQWVIFISPRGTIAATTRLMATMLPPGAGPTHLPEFPKTPPVGIGVKLSVTGLESRLTIPAAVLESVGPYIQQLKGGNAVGAEFVR